jgi:hypothetical protein
MVSKLLLAAQETLFRAVDSGAPLSLLKRLAACYDDIRAGLGDRKSPEEYGAFPMDPYSHTPANGGARQPGLTGQVKEDILCRWGELGVFVQNGEIGFRPLLLRREEFLNRPGQFRYFDLAGNERSLRLPMRSLAFTYCGIPIVYRLTARNSLQVVRSDGTSSVTEEWRLDAATSHSVFNRAGEVSRIVVSIEAVNGSALTTFCFR